jgi:hypothetical protein
MQYNQLRPKSGKNYPAYGYKKSITERLLEIFFSILIKFFFLNHPNKISNLFLQCLNPLAILKFKNHKLKFRTGHGRLLWRVKRFYSEEKIMTEWLKNCEKHIKSFINNRYKIIKREKPEKAILGENLIFKKIN